MRARIYQPARNAMQSGTGKAKGWVLVFESREARDIDPLMGWTSSADTQNQVVLQFDSREAALDYASAPDRGRGDRSEAAQGQHPPPRLRREFRDRPPRRLDALSQPLSLGTASALPAPQAC